MVKPTNSKVLPTKTHWIAIILLSLLATVSTLRLPGGWILYVFPALLFLFGRGRQTENEGFKR